MTKYLDWNNILNDSCPSCGYFMAEEENRYICKNHRGDPFVIPKKRFIEIKRALQAKQDFAFPDF